MNRVSPRAALQEAMHSPARSHSRHPGGGVPGALLSSLGGGPVTIDATTQPGYNGTPLVELNGRTQIQTGLTLSAGNSTVRGLAINRFRRAGIQIADRGGNRIVGNYIGTDGTGTIPRGNFGDGVRIERSSGNIIGGTGPGEANLIANNGGDGVSVVGTVPAGMVSLWRGDGNADDSIETNHGSLVRRWVRTRQGRTGFAFDGSTIFEFPITRA